MKQLCSHFLRLLRIFSTSDFHISFFQAKHFLLGWITLAFIFLSQPLKAQDNSKQKRSVTSTAVWSFELPPTQSVGPKRVSVNFEFFFVRDGLYINHATLNLKVTRMWLGVEDGTPAFRYKGHEFTGNELSAIDGMSHALTGFDEINITGIVFSVNITGGSNPKRIQVSNGNTGYVKVTGITDDTDLNNLNIDWSSATTTEIRFSNSLSLQTRINKVLLLTQNREKYKTVIRAADAAFHSKNFLEAKSKYTMASNLLPGEQYPQDQLDKINGILSDQKSQAVKKLAAADDSNGSGHISDTNSPTKNKGTTTSSAGNDDDFWGTKTKTSTTNSGKQAGIPEGTPPMVMDKQGNYYVQDESGKYVKTTKENYDATKKSFYANRNKESTSSESITDFNERLKNANDAYNNKINRIQQESQEVLNKTITSYYTAVALNKSQKSFNEVKTLSGNFANEEELNMEFSQKYSQISGEVDNLINAKNNNLQNAADNLLVNSDAKTQAVGQGVAAGLKIMNTLSAEKKAQKAKEELAQQKAAMLAQFERQKKQTLMNYRSEFLTQFPDGGVPLSSHKVPSTTLYYFAYTFDKQALENPAPPVSLTNVFKVTQYSDGTWPFKNSLINEIKKLGGTGDVTIMGYYASEELASSLRSSFLNMATKGKFLITQTEYKGKASSAGGNTDFWGTPTGKKQENPEVKQDPAKKEEDFWETGKKTDSEEKQELQKKESKSNDDFWNQ